MATNETKIARKQFSVNPIIGEDTPVKYNHVDIYFKNGRMEISGMFECKKIETAYNRFRKIMIQVAESDPLFKGWDSWDPAKKITACTDRGWYDACGDLQPYWADENGDYVFGNGDETLRVDINDDTFYLWGFFTLGVDEYADFIAKFGEAKNLYDDEQADVAVDETETDGSEDDIDADDAFNFLPDLDELNDVCSVPQARPFTVETSYTPYGDVRTKLHINDEKISLFNGEFVRLWNGKYHAYISNLNGGKIGVVMPGESLTQLFRDFDLDEPSEEFFKIMAERGACTIDECEILRNKIADLETELDKIENEYDKGGNQDKLDKLANRWDELYLKLCQQKEDYKQKYRAGVRETCELINDAAPEGWSISAAVTFTRSDINHPKTQYRIHFHGELIAELDSLALAKFLSIDEFFEQFKPLVDKNFTPAEQNIRARQREIDDLNEMRKELGNDTERLKILDELIDDAQREKIRNELAG